jgi:hypothetical protein
MRSARWIAEVTVVKDRLRQFILWASQGNSLTKAIQPTEITRRESQDIPEYHTIRSAIVNLGTHCISARAWRTLAVQHSAQGRSATILAALIIAERVVRFSSFCKLLLLTLT